MRGDFTTLHSNPVVAVRLVRPCYLQIVCWVKIASWRGLSRFGSQGTRLNPASRPRELRVRRGFSDDLPQYLASSIHQQIFSQRLRLDSPVET